MAYDEMNVAYQLDEIGYVADSGVDSGVDSDAD